MAREARKISKSGNYYIVLRGEELFVTEDDKKQFVQILEKNFATGIVHGYYISKNEIRLAVKEGTKGISMTMKPATTSYARYFNRVHNRQGKLFSGRFISEPLETEEEIEECIKTLKSKKTVRRTAAARDTKRAAEKTEKKTKQVKKATPKKETVKKEEKAKPKRETQKNLPSWLL